jgi:hypothetical protein
MAASWRLAESLRVLRDEVDALAPKRSKASDGTVGDTAHATRWSDHNPWVQDRGAGVVTARDITHDPENGLDAGALAEHFRAMGKAGDPRIKYVIWNRRICSFIENWRWREYSGPNAHKHHVHVSVSSKRRYYDSRRPWGLRPEPVAKPKPVPPDTQEPRPPAEEDHDMKSDETIDLGKWGTAVLRDPDGQISFEEALAIQTVATAQTNEATQRMVELQEAILAELKRLNASGK